MSRLPGATRTNIHERNADAKRKTAAKAPPASNVPEGVSLCPAVLPRKWVTWKAKTSSDSDERTWSKPEASTAVPLSL